MTLLRWLLSFHSWLLSLLSSLFSLSEFSLFAEFLVSLGDLSLIRWLLNRLRWLLRLFRWLLFLLSLSMDLLMYFLYLLRCLLVTFHIPYVTFPPIMQLQSIALAYKHCTTCCSYRCDYKTLNLSYISTSRFFIFHPNFSLFFPIVPQYGVINHPCDL